MVVMADHKHVWDQTVSLSNPPVYSPSLCKVCGVIAPRGGTFTTTYRVQGPVNVRIGDRYMYIPDLDG